MMYQSSKLKLNCIQVVLNGSVNDVYICQDENSQDKTRYTVIAVKDHETTKRLLRVCDSAGVSIRSVVVDEFSTGDEYILVLPYVKERPIELFYSSTQVTLEKAEELCASLVLACIQSVVPFPLLYLILKQGLIHMSKDMTAYLGYGIDLSELSEERQEKDCVIECARVLIKCLEPFSGQKADSYTLLEKRIASSGYRKFAELYKDITIAAIPREKYGFIYKAKRFWNHTKDTLFRVLLALCVVIAVVALVSLILQMITGDVPWLRFFINSFKTIGTESLNK